MTRRYFAPELPSGGGLVTLSAEESRHAIRVMRVSEGDEVTLFNGDGREAQAKVVELGRNECQLQTFAPESVDREPSIEVHIAVALPKPDRARELIERLTELGVKSLTPLVAARSQRPPSRSLLEKLRRGVIEACKQCGRNRLLEIRETEQAMNFFQMPKTGSSWIAHVAPDAVPIAEATTADSVTAAVGPEGGWTDDEVQCARENGYQAIDLGKRIYRIETAATVIAAKVT